MREMSQKELYSQIVSESEKLKKLDEEIDEFQRAEDPFSANDAKSEADLVAEKLISLLQQAIEKKMRGPEFPLLKSLYHRFQKKLIFFPL